VSEEGHEKSEGCDALSEVQRGVKERGLQGGGCGCEMAAGAAAVLWRRGAAVHGAGFEEEASARAARRSSVGLYVLGTTPCLSVTDMVNVHKEGSLQGGGCVERGGWVGGGWVGWGVCKYTDENCARTLLRVRKATQPASPW